MNYKSFLNTKTSSQWKKIGVKRRAGVVVPLFSVWSEKSPGIGEYTDLKKVADWCKSNGLSIIQLLPLNEMGGDFSPYNAISSFALEPAYLNLSDLKSVILTNNIRSRIRELDRSSSTLENRVDYRIKSKKLKILSEIFTNSDKYDSDFLRFERNNSHWLEDFALFKKLIDLHKSSNWFKWEKKFRDRNSDALNTISEKYNNDLVLTKWLQWQCYSQLKNTKRYCDKKGIILIGDLPYLVSPESADVWAERENFRMEKVAGAPPDMYLSTGQRWGMHPYNWYNIAAKDFDYVKRKIQYAENFYHAYRIDHFIGLFRIWTIDKVQDEKLGGINGSFEPADEKIWEQHGREILNEIIKSSDMLPVAEDLGTVPECSNSVLHEYGIPGMEVMRWKKNYHNGFAFEDTKKYRLNSVAVLSTHDSSTFPVWWKYEMSNVDLYSFKNELISKGLSTSEVHSVRLNFFKKKINAAGKIEWRKKVKPGFIDHTLEKFGDDVNWFVTGLYNATYFERKFFSDLIGVEEKMKIDEEVVEKNLFKILESSSVFSIQLLMEWLYLDDKILRKKSSWKDRINFPGTVSNRNWTWRSPLSIEKILSSDINKKIKYLVKKTAR